MKTRIKKSFICSDVDSYQVDTVRPQYYVPRVGDVAIFEVLTIGKHTKMQSANRRNVSLMPGDQIMAAFGTRYATGQFEGYVPDTVQQEFHILGGGGTVGHVHSMHSKFHRIGPTCLRIVGYATNAAGEVINTKRLKAEQMHTFSGASASFTKVILSVGSSMDSGKTTSAAYLVHGLKKQGKKVAYIKLTGTVYTKDADLAYDLGADIATDFSYFGYPSTYLCSETELLNLYESLLRLTLDKQPDYVVIEIADGIIQRETKILMTNHRFMNTVDEVIFSAGDSLAAIQGIQTLESWGIIPTALCGMFTASPLLVAEVKEYSSVPVYNLEDLTGEGAKQVISRAQLRIAQ
ncbi:MAG: hypothetical protein AAF223_15280 [Bacteroidota bacterium]